MEHTAATLDQHWLTCTRQASKHALRGGAAHAQGVDSYMGFLEKTNPSASEPPPDDPDDPPYRPFIGVVVPAAGAGARQTLAGGIGSAKPAAAACGGHGSEALMTCILARAGDGGNAADVGPTTTTSDHSEDEEDGGGTDVPGPKPAPGRPGGAKAAAATAAGAGAKGRKGPAARGGAVAAAHGGVGGSSAKGAQTYGEQPGTARTQAAPPEGELPAKRRGRWAGAGGAPGAPGACKPPNGPPAVAEGRAGPLLEGHAPPPAPSLSMGSVPDGRARKSHLPKDVHFGGPGTKATPAGAPQSTAAVLPPGGRPQPATSTAAAAGVARPGVGSSPALHGNGGAAAGAAAAAAAQKRPREAQAADEAKAGGRAKAARADPAAAQQQRQAEAEGLPAELAAARLAIAERDQLLAAERTARAQLEQELEASKEQVRVRCLLCRGGGRSLG